MTTTIGRTPNEGLTYLRRSTEKQEGGIYNQLDWALAKAEEHKVRLDARRADLDHMLERGLTHHKGIFWDSSTGADLNRPGFVAFRQLALRERRLSHLFIYMRDRFARPEMVTQAMLLEQEMLYAGLTVVFSDRQSMPRQRGMSYPAEDMQMYFSYWESAEYLYKLSARVIECQRGLAAKGFWTGGRPPYGFVRVRVCDDGTEVEMSDRTSIRRPGSHTEVRPKDLVKIGHWLMMLNWCEKEGWGAKRIAIELNRLGVPSPDVGRFRTEKNGLKHPVSGLWNPNTVRALLRNTVIIGLLRYGVQAEGHHRRLGPDGPRMLTDADRREDGIARVINNPPELIISRPLAGLEAQVDLARFERCQQILDERGKNQRGIPRPADPTRYPLGTRVFDCNCTYPMYGRTSGDRRMYTCGLYLKCGPEHCHHNQIDAEALLAYVLDVLRQRVTFAGGRRALRARLVELAASSAALPQIDPHQQELARLENRLLQVRQQYDLLGLNLGRAQNDLEFQVLRPQLQQKHGEVERLECEVEQLRGRVGRVGDGGSVESEIDAALALFEEIEQVTGDPAGRAKVPSLLRRLNLHVFLNFAAGVKGKQRAVRVLTGGLITTGDAALPIRPYGGGKHGHCQAEGNGQRADVPLFPLGESETPSVDLSGRQEGVSYTKVNRGDKI